MADYTKLEKRAQEIFDDILVKYHEYDPEFDIGTIDPVLSFSNNITRYGACSDVKDKDTVYKQKVDLSRATLVTESHVRSTLVHELVHAIGYPYHNKEFKNKLKELNEFFNIQESDPDIEGEKNLRDLAVFDPVMYKKVKDHQDELERRWKERQKKYEEEKKKEKAWMEKIRKESKEKAKNKTKDELLGEIRIMTQKKQA